MAMSWLEQPWPWYVAGPLIGLTVPLLLLLGNRRFGISSSLRHLCAIAVRGRVPFFNYNWRAEAWSLAFVLGIVIGGFLAGVVWPNSHPPQINPQVAAELQRMGLEAPKAYMPPELFSLASLLNLKTLLFLLGGGFLIGFGSRWANGCTSGHAITGLSALQLPSLIAVIGFFIGGLVSAHWLLPLILR